MTVRKATTGARPPNTSTQRKPGRMVLDAISSAAGAVMASIAAPYETAATGSQLPVVGNPGPISLSRYAASNRALARHFVRTDGIFRSAFEKLAQGVVGTGPVPRTKFRELLPQWREFERQSDPAGQLPLGLRLHKAYKDQELVGDLFIRIRPRYLSDGLVVPMQLQFLESEFLPYGETKIAANGNRIVNGIEVDHRDGRVAYHFHRNHPNDPALNATNTTLARVPAEEVLHLVNPERVNGLRGEGRGVAAMVMLWMLHGYLTDEMKRKKLLSRLAVFIRDADGREVSLPGETDSESAAEQHIRVLQSEAGDFFQLPQSTNVEIPQISDTSGNAVAHLRFMSLVITAAIGVPVELVLGDWQNVSDRTANYSSTFFDTFIAGERRRLEFQVLNPLWRRFVDLQIATGQWTPGDGVPTHKLYEVTWSWPRRSYKHPLQEIQALLAKMRAGLIDRFTVIEELGYDPYEIDLRQASARLRAERFGNKYDSHEGTGEETEESKRLDELEAEQIDAAIREMEEAEADEGVLDE